MSEQIRGIILEGQSCSGKTSIFTALKKLHPDSTDAERNSIFLGEHYSQNLNYVHGQLKNMSKEENMIVLQERVRMLETLSQYADSMGVHSRRSRGLFYTFERFHLNYAYCFTEDLDAEYDAIENRLRSLHAITVLCTISETEVENRLRHRAAYTGDTITNQTIDEYMKNQNRFITLAQNSKVPTIILNTDSREWEEYAKQLLQQNF